MRAFTRSNDFNYLAAERADIEPFTFNACTPQRPIGSAISGAPLSICFEDCGLTLFPAGQERDKID